MLDNLRAMAIFASVVNHGSFGGAAKEFGITTSGVSQQIRALEKDLGVVLLHRSTRKLSLTEAGLDLLGFAQNIVKSAQDAKDSISQIRDGVFGGLRLATTPRLVQEHIYPALSDWLDKNNELSLLIFSDNHQLDMVKSQIDIAVYFSDIKDNMENPLMQVEQLLVASPKYISRYGVPQNIQALKKHQLIGYGDGNSLSFAYEIDSVKFMPQFLTNDEVLALSLAKNGRGILKTNRLEVADHLKAGELVPILQEVKLPDLVLYAKVANKEQQPIKVKQCLDLLQDYFSKLQN
ncbi:LysR family transcriptional regulator (plasmid) [Moraxella bovis]|uniref:LysR family transcriptional regulator n=1 Tax=Moraxella bovis TaxID=476 RepID=A0ABY6MEB8_MORBO|nr:LysR family transcriptional regulator [Moraxella bovis]UZA04812.1 LysR family transcriptional regulator [Moraxella bovis]